MFGEVWKAAAHNKDDSRKEQIVAVKKPKGNSDY
jgi:hypothetical protein